MSNKSFSSDKEKLIDWEYKLHFSRRLYLLSIEVFKLCISKNTVDPSEDGEILKQIFSSSMGFKDDISLDFEDQTKIIDIALFIYNQWVKNIGFPSSTNAVEWQNYCAQEAYLKTINVMKPKPQKDKNSDIL